MNKKKLQGSALIFFIIVAINLPNIIKAFAEKGVGFGIAYTIISLTFYICLFALAAKAGTLIAEGEVEKLREKYEPKRPFGISDETMGALARQVIDGAKNGAAGLEICIKNGEPSVRVLNKDEVKAKLVEKKKESKQVGRKPKATKKVTKSKK